MLPARNTEERAGLGLRAMTDRGELLVGKRPYWLKTKWLFPKTFFKFPIRLWLWLDGRYAGYLLLADEPKPDASRAVTALHALGYPQPLHFIRRQVGIGGQIGRTIRDFRYFGDLMPEDKVRHIEEFQTKEHARVAFVGDGLNDAPVLAASRVGIAMGGLGSDVAIEAADIILQTDQPSKIAEAIRIGRRTRAVVWQNIIGALGVKLLVLALGASGAATLWEAVFADVGVALLAILNAVRLLSNKKIKPLLYYGIKHVPLSHSYIGGIYIMEEDIYLHKLNLRNVKPTAIRLLILRTMMEMNRCRVATRFGRKTANRG